MKVIVRAPEPVEDVIDITGLTRAEALIIRQALLNSSGLPCLVSDKTTARRLHDEITLNY